MVRENKLKRSLREGRVVKGLIQAIPNPDIVEMLGDIGWDFIQLEGEHGISIDEGKILLMAADAANITPTVKVAGFNPFLVAPWLDAGIQGIKFPHVRTKEEAEQAVKVCKHPPVGERSYCPLTRIAGHAPFAHGDYSKRADEETMILLGIEDLEGLKNLEDIASVKGIDVIAIGPGDMAAAMGVPGQPDHPRVLEAFIHLIDVCKAKGVVAGVNPGNYAQAKLLAERGAQYIMFSADKMMIYHIFQRVKRNLDQALEGISFGSKTAV